MIDLKVGTVEKFKRGQIWWVRKDKDEEERRTEDPNYHLTTKTRPWLIVSTDEFNTCTGKVTMVPIITNNINSTNDLHLTNIKLFVDQKERFAKCSELMSFNWIDVDGEYIATVSDKDMARIDDAVSYYLGLNKPTMSLKDIEDLLTKKLEEINQTRKEEDEQLFSLFEKISSIADK